MQNKTINASDMTMSEMGKAVFYRTYSRPVENGRENFENTVDRMIDHQRWLWERQKGEVLDLVQLSELEELREIYMKMKALPRG